MIHRAGIISSFKAQLSSIETRRRRRDASYAHWSAGAEPARVKSLAVPYPRTYLSSGASGALPPSPWLAAGLIT